MPTRFETPAGITLIEYTPDEWRMVYDRPLKVPHYRIKWGTHLSGLFPWPPVVAAPDEEEAA